MSADLAALKDRVTRTLPRSDPARPLIESLPTEPTPDQLLYVLQALQRVNVEARS